MAQLIKVLLCKREGLSLDPRDALKKLGILALSVIKAPGSQRQEDSCNLIACCTRWRCCASCENF